MRGFQAFKGTYCMHISFFHSAGTSLFEGGGTVTSVPSTQGSTTLEQRYSGLGMPPSYSMYNSLRLNLFVTYHY